VEGAVNQRARNNHLWTLLKRVSYLGSDPASTQQRGEETDTEEGESLSLCASRDWLKADVHGLPHLLAASPAHHDSAIAGQRPW
jgi:hypothetical protein